MNACSALAEVTLSLILRHITLNRLHARRHALQNAMQQMQHLLVEVAALTCRTDEFHSVIVLDRVCYMSMYR